MKKSLGNAVSGERRGEVSLQRMYDFSVLREIRKGRGLSLSDMSDCSGVSIAVISKLERNQTVADLDTIYRLGRVFGMNPSELLSLAESRSAQKHTARSHKSGDFIFQEVRYGNIRCLYGSGKSGSRVSDPRVHQDDYELCWVLEGRLLFHLPHERTELKSGEAIQFDALLEHSYEALEDSRFLIIHIRKSKRF
ncbi:MAG: helix-turn-helix domain-containing protein [Victivallales bacterium]|nr:helix-turn-helix domain-containing protein [Victivallales bacterium]